MDILGLLDAAYNGNKVERTQATASLEEALKSSQGPAHLLTLIRAGVDTALPAERSLSALIYAKNCLIHTMPDELLGSAPAMVAAIEEVLLEGVFRVPETHRRIVYECVTTLISGFQWNYLTQLMPLLGINLEGTSAEYSCALLGMLYAFMKRFKTINLVPMDIKMEVCEACIRALPAYFAYNDFRVSHLTLKLMECVIETALQLDKSSGMSGNTLDAWLTLMADFPESHYQAAATAGGKVYEVYVRCAKRIAMISFSVINDATRRKKPAPLAAHFLQAFGERFLNVWRQWLQSCITAKDRGAHRKSEMFAIRYIKLCTLSETLYRRCVRPAAIQIIESLLFPYLCYGEDDEEVFADEENLSEFVQYMTDEGITSGELSQRQAASNAILAIVGGKKKFHDPKTLLQELISVLTQGLALPDSSENYPRLFGFMHLLSILRKYLRDIPEIWSGQMAQVLMSYVAPRIGAHIQSVALRCKAIVVCMRYSKVPMPTEQDFASFVHMTCALVGDTDPRIRLSGIDAICTLLEMKRARQYLIPILVPLVEECILFLNRVQTTFVPTVILHLATHFAPELTPVMGKLGSTLVQHFLSTAFDLEQQEMGEMDDTQLATYERAAFSADALLDAIYTVVTSCSENIPAFEAMRPDMIRLTRRVLEQPDCFDFMDKTLCIFLHVVNFSKPIPAECWDVMPLIFHSVDAGIGVDFFNTIEEVLDNFISNGTVEYLTNPTIMEATYDVCHKMLIGNVVCSAECQMAAAQLIEAMLHQAKGCVERQGLFDLYLARFASLLLQALIHPDVASGDVRVRIWVIAAIMDCFYYNAGATLDALVQANAYPQFFDGLLHFFRECFDTSAQQQREAAAVKTKKGKKSKKRDEAAEVVEQLSLLTRKVLILGLSSLLSFLVSPASVAHPCYATFVAHYQEPVMSLVQYCVFTNESTYEPRCRVSEENLAKIRAGVEDEVEDIDVNDEQVLGVDGGDDTGDAYDDLSEADDYDEAEGISLEIDEADDYESPIDEVNEVQFFLQWASMMPTQSAEVQKRMSNVLRSETEYSKAAAVAGRYRALCLELEQAMQEDFKARSAQVTAPRA